VNYMQKPGLFIPSYKDTVEFGEYLLRKGDRIYVKVYSTDDKINTVFSSSGSMQLMNNNAVSNDLFTYLIDEDGTIKLPMIGNVKIEGLTIRQARFEIEKSLSPLFSRENAVFFTVELKIAERYFSIVGNSIGGLIAMPKEKINIFQALALAGDIGIYGDKSKVRILRETDHGTIIKSFDVRSEDIVHSEFFYVEPNDVIYVQNLDQQFFSITNLPGLLSTFFSTVSFGVFLYNVLIPQTN